MVEVPAYAKAAVSSLLGRFLSSMRFHVQSNPGLNPFADLTEKVSGRMRGSDGEKKKGVFARMFSRDENVNWLMIMKTLTGSEHDMMAEYVRECKRRDFSGYKNLILNASGLFGDFPEQATGVLRALAASGLKVKETGGDWFDAMHLASEHLRVNTFGIGVGSALNYLKESLVSVSARISENEQLVSMRKELEVMRLEDERDGKEGVVESVIDGVVRRRKEKQSIGILNLRAWWSS